MIRVGVLSLSGLRSYNRCYNLKMQFQVQQETKSHKERKKQARNKSVHRKPVAKVERSRETSHEQCVNQ